MGSPGDIWLCFLLIVLISFLFFLRIKFAKASKAAETAVLITFAIVFFSLLHLLLKGHAASSDTGVGAAMQVSAARR
jgi:hypothetical protein